MNGLLAYSGLTTKVHAMSKNLITPSEYDEIINLSSVTDVINYLKQHPGYSNVFEDTDISLLHRGDMEMYLNVSIYHDFAKLYNFSSNKQRKYLELYFNKFETYLLKQTLREILDGKSPSINIPLLNIYYERFSKINLQALSQSSSITEYIDALRCTEYYEPLLRVYNLGTSSLFDYELCLDLYYFSTLWKNKDKILNGKDHEIITETYGYRIDLLNIQWIYRCKRFYQISDAEVLAMLIPINYKLSKAQIKSMVEADNVQSMINVFSQTSYGRKISFSSEESFEKVYRMVLDKTHSSKFKNSPYTLACIDNYLYKKQNEISKIITITECIRYSYTPADIYNILEQ